MHTVEHHSISCGTSTKKQSNHGPNSNVYGIIQLAKDSFGTTNFTDWNYPIVLVLCTKT